MLTWLQVDAEHRHRSRRFDDVGVGWQCPGGTDAVVTHDSRHGAAGTDHRIPVAVFYVGTETQRLDADGEAGVGGRQSPGGTDQVHPMVPGSSTGQHRVDDHVVPRPPSRPHHAVLDERVLDAPAGAAACAVVEEQRGIGARVAVPELDIAAEAEQRRVGELAVLGSGLLQEGELRSPFARQDHRLVGITGGDPTGVR